MLYINCPYCRLCMKGTNDLCMMCGASLKGSEDAELTDRIKPD